jgi:hypothetical protein
MVTARAIWRAPAWFLASSGMRRFHVTVGRIAIPDNPNRAPKADRKTGIPCDFAIDRWRYRIANLFCDLKQRAESQHDTPRQLGVLPP